MTHVLATHSSSTISTNPLPIDLLHHVFGLLPISSKLSCKCVCKLWYSILSNDPILTYTTNPPSTTSKSTKFGSLTITTSSKGFLLTTKGPFVYSLSPTTNLWTRLPPLPLCPGLSSILCASNGLVCLGNLVSECRSLLVLNLLSTSSKLLPSMLHVGFLHKVTMVVHPTNHTYIIVVSGEDSSNIVQRYTRSPAYRLLTEVYDSVTNSWTTVGDALPDAKFGSDPGAWCRGLFYCITELPYGLVAFDLARGKWIDDFMSVRMPESITFPSLLSWMGHLVMVGIQDSCALNYDEYEDEVNILTSPPSPALSCSSSSMSYNLLPRSWSWSGPLQLLAASSSSFLSTMSTWSSSLSLSSSPSSSSLLSTWSSPSSSPSPSPLPLPLGSTLKTSRPLRIPSKRIKVWYLCNDTKHQYWKLLEEMPEEMCLEFMSNFSCGTPLVCGGVGDDLCITSHRSPMVVVLNMRSMTWRFAERDPVFPKHRDSHLLGFTIDLDKNCIP